MGSQAFFKKEGDWLFEAGETDLNSLLSIGSSNTGRDVAVSSAPSAWGQTWKGSEREVGGVREGGGG